MATREERAEQLKIVEELEKQGYTFTPVDYEPGGRDSQSINESQFADLKAQGYTLTPVDYDPLSSEGVERGGVMDTVKAVPAAVGQAVMGISESALRTPSAIERGLEAVNEWGRDIGLPEAVTKSSGIGIGDVARQALLNYTTGQANDISDAQQLLNENVDVFGRLTQKGQFADQAFSKAIDGDFNDLGLVLTDPEAWAGFIGQAAPSLYLAYQSGGSIPFIAWLESMEVANDAADFEERTGQKIDPREFTKAVAQVATINSVLERYGLDKVVGSHGGNVLSSMLRGGITEAGTEGLQQVNTNLAARLNYDPSRSLSEGVLPSMMGGLGTGAPAAGAFHIASGSAESGAYDTLEPIDMLSDEPGDTAESILALSGPSQRSALPGPGLAGALPAPEVAPGRFSVNTEGQARPTYQSEVPVEPDNAIDFEPTPVPSALSLAPEGAPVMPAREEAGIDFQLEYPSLDADLETRQQVDKRIEQDKRISKIDEELGDVKLPPDFPDARLKRLEFRRELLRQADVKLPKKIVGVDPRRDSVLEAIAKKGGVSLYEAREQGIDPEHFKDLPGDQNPFRVHGRSFDAMAESLSDEGYLPEEGYTANRLLEMISDELSGKPHYSKEVDPGFQEAVKSLRYPGMTVDQVQAAIKKALNGKRLGRRQTAAVEAALERVTTIRDDGGAVEVAMQEREKRRQRRREIAKDLISVEYYDSLDGERAYEDNFYEASEDEDGNTLEELAELAHDLGGDAEQIAALLDTQKENAHVARNLYQYIGTLQDGRQPDQSVDTGSDRGTGSREESNRSQSEGEISGAPTEGRGIEKTGRAEKTGEVTPLDEAAHEAATSPENPLPEPTDSQKEAGNYKKGHVSLHGLDITIENPKGSERTGTSKSGKKWAVTMQNHYGYFKRTEGKDGDHVDVFLGPDAENADLPVYVIDQVDPDTRRFDEHKVLMGYPSGEAAHKGYLANYEKGWSGLGGAKQFTLGEFKEWLKNGDTKKRVTKPDTVELSASAEPLASTKPAAESGSPGETPQKKKIEDFGEKIGGARKDVAAKTGQKTVKKTRSDIPAWRRRYAVTEIAADNRNPENKGKFYVWDNKTDKAIRQGYKPLVFDAEEQAEVAIPGIEVARNHRVSMARKDNKYDQDIWEIVRVVSDRKRPVIKSGFASRDEAMEYMAHNAVEIIETKTRIDDSIHPALERAIRKGARRRAGDKDVGAKDFEEVFGFRGVEFGNWNNNAERQHILNQAYDAFLDLAEMLKIPPKAVSLNGELAVAFGSRGQGLSGARAHYERSYAVINLTKIKGAGALAHEWLHAFDHYLARLSGKVKSEKITNRRGDEVYNTKGPHEYVSHGFRYNATARAELIEAFNNVIDKVMHREVEFKEDLSGREKIEHRQKEELIKKLDAFREELAKDYSQEKYPRYRGKKNNSPATKEQLAEADRIIDEVKSGNYGELEFVAGKGLYSGVHLYSQVKKLNDVFKEARGRKGYQKTGNYWGGLIYEIHAAVNNQKRAEDFLADAQEKRTKTKKVATEYYSEAWKMDQGAKADYWSSNHEMLARAFEAYIYDRLQYIDARNDFLAYEKHNNLPEYLFFKVKPYPEGAERENINRAFGNLFNVIEHKEEGGKAPLFSKKASEEFYQNSKGDIDFGEISDDISRVIRRQAGKIRLEEGDGNYGMRHIIDRGHQDEIIAYGFPSVEAFVAEVAENYEAIYRTRDGRLALTLSRSEGKSAKVLMVQLVPGDYYSVTTAYITSKRRLKSMELLWERSDTRSTGPGGQPAFARSSVSKSGQKPSNAISSRDNSIGRRVEKINPSNKGKGRFTADEVRETIQPILENAENIPNIEVVQSVRDLPEDARDPNAKGVFYPANGRIYLVADNLTSRADIKKTLAHEMVGHWSVEELLGGDFEAITQRIQNLKKSGNRAILELAGQVRETHGDLDATTEAKEIIALIAETRAGKGALTRSLVTLWEQIKSAIRKAFKAIGLRVPFSESELADMVIQAERNVNAGKGISEEKSVSDGEALYSKRKSASTKVDGLNRQVREMDQTLMDKARKTLRRYLAPGGLLPQKAFEAKIRRDSEFEVIEFDSRHLIGQLERSVQGDYGRRFEDLPRPEQTKMTDFLAGKEVAGLPTKTKETLAVMRRYIDGLSKEYMLILLEEAKQLQAAGDDNAAFERAGLLETIANNLGHYIHRSYRAFDDPHWYKHVSDEALNQARQYLTDQYIDKGDSRAEAKRRAEVSIHEILKTSTAYDSMESFIREAKLGAKDLSVLKRRKQIAPEIRALLGEYNDVRLNFAKSATKMGRLIWNQRFLDKIREVGMGVFLFEGDDRPPAATKKVAAEGSEIYAPLNGLWTFPEVEQAFRDALGRENMANWYRTIVQMNGLVKFGKTVLSPTTAARNWQSAMFFALANGHFDMRHMAKSVSGLREYFTHQGKGEKLRYLRKLKHLGVVYDTPYAGEMMRLLDDTRIENTLLAGKGRLKFREAMSLATKFYQFGDDFWKIIGFENEKRLLMKHGKMTEAQAEKEAAERIRNTYPTYSMVGKAIQSLRRFPLAGTFVSFPAEVIRTTGNIVRYIAKDMKTPGMRPIALRRAAGLGLVASFAYALQELSKIWFDVDDDDEEAMRLLAAPWQRNSNLVFVGRDEKGNLRYIDMSFLDPYNYFKRPITAVMRDQPWEDMTADIFKETLTPFLGTDIAAGAIFDVLANKRESGGPVYKEHDVPWQQTVDIANHLRKTLQPGLAANIERTWRAMKGETSSSGRKYNLADEGLAWIGWRVSTIDPKTSLYYRVYDFKDAKRDASKTINDVLRSPNKVASSELQSALKLSLDIHARAYNEFIKIIAAARNSGLSNLQIRRILKNSGVSKRDSAYLLRGQVPPWRPSTASLRNAMKKADVLFDDEAVSRIRGRYQEAKKLAREYQGK